jgi:AcrR family transcriptional regulator
MPQGPASQNAQRALAGAGTAAWLASVRADVGAAESAGETKPDPRAEILTAAAACFTAKGFVATSIDDVARAMGATKGRVYHYWRSKLDLFVDVVRFSLDLIHIKVSAAEGEGAPEDRMGRMVCAHLASILRDQPFHRCALQGVDMHLRAATTPEQREALKDIIALRDRHEKLFERVLRDGQETGVFAPGPSGVMVRTLLPALNGAVFWYRKRDDETDADREDLIEGIASFALRGLGADPGRKKE